jgi:hypothetical protein
VHKSAQALSEKPETELPQIEVKMLAFDPSDQADAEKIKAYECN